MKVDLIKLTQKILYGEIQEVEPPEEQVEEIDTTKKPKRKKRAAKVEEQKVETKDETLEGKTASADVDNQLPSQGEDKPVGPDKPQAT